MAVVVDTMAAGGVKGGADGSRHLNCGQVLAAALRSQASAGIATESTALETARVRRELEPAWDVVADRAVKLVGAERQRGMIDRVYAAVAANVCGGLTPRSGTFQTAFAVLGNDALRAMREPDRKRHEPHLRVHCGTFTDLLTVEARLSPDASRGNARAPRALANGAAADWDEHPGAVTGEGNR